MRFGFGVAADKSDRGGGDQGHGRPARPRRGHPVTAQHHQNERRANPRCGGCQPVGLRGERLVPAFPFVAVIGQGGVGLCITVQVVDEAIEQFVRGVEVELFGIAGVALLERRPQAADTRRQRFLIGTQGYHQACRIGAGQCATTEAVEHFGEVLQTRFDGGHHMISRTAAQTLEQLMQGVEARGDAHELAVRAD